MKLLFLGESWRGSSARSLKESLCRITVSHIDEIDEINEDLYFPKSSALWLRAIHRLLIPAYRRELANAVIKKCRYTRPDVLLVYKGSNIDAQLVRAVKAMGVFTVNVFPDYSPHAYGARLRRAIGEYDLVISTKPFHPGLWQSLYGYRNRCVFVPHGYDSSVHLIRTPSTEFQFDLGLVATWRPEYHSLMLQVARSLEHDLVRVAIAGNGWVERASAFPSHWILTEQVLGTAYARWAQRAKIMIAPVNREVVIRGQRHPGDEDSTRTYELAAAHCFFLHRRTDYVETVYEGASEVPFFDDAEELVKLVRQFLTEDELRSKMAAAAHARAVPAYSIDSRAKQIETLIRSNVDLRHRGDS